MCLMAMSPGYVIFFLLLHQEIVDGPCTPTTSSANGPSTSATVSGHLHLSDCLWSLHLSDCLYICHGPFLFHPVHLKPPNPFTSKKQTESHCWLLEEQEWEGAEAPRGKRGQNWALPRAVWAHDWENVIALSWYISAALYFKIVCTVQLFALLPFLPKKKKKCFVCTTAVPTSIFLCMLVIV